jgi:uncharacterized protein
MRDSASAMPFARSAAASAARIETIVLQPTPFCNIDCSYCYLPKRNANTVMEHDTITTLFAKLFASGWADRQLTVIWHAGEPLVLPAAYYEAAFTAIEAMRPDEVEVRHAMQTNGMLITPEWCGLFRKWGVGVGVSIDGPRHLHDAHRVTRSGRGTFDRTIAGIRLLRQEEVPFHVISVLSQGGVDAPEEMLEFYLAEGIQDVCFNVEESEGRHLSGLFAATDAQARFIASWTVSGDWRAPADGFASFEKSMPCCHGSFARMKRQCGMYR